MAAKKYTDATMADNFITKYGPGSMLLYDGSTPMMSMIKKTFELSGTDFQQRVDLSMGVGVGAGTLPEASVHKIDKMVITEKDLYARAKIQRKAIYKAKNKGAFIDSLDDTVDTTVKGFGWYVESQLFNTSGAGRGTIDTGGVSGASPGPYVLTISAATWKVANFEVGILVNVGTSDILFEVTAISPSARTITVEARNGVYLPVQADVIYMQGSQGLELTGLKDIVDATSGNLYSIPVGYRWQAQQVAAGGTGLTVELLDQANDQLFDIVGMGANLIVTSTTQARRLRAQYEDLKRYVDLSPSNKALKGQLGFQGLDYHGPTGPAPIITSRFVEADRVYLLNTNKMELRHMQGGGWFKDDLGGSGMWLREMDSDSYEARYGYYMEFVCIPTFQATITGLAV